MKNHYKILIFDIDSGFLKKVRDEIDSSQLSVEISVVEHQNDVIQAIRDYKPDLILTLLLFPSSDGLEILQVLRQIYRDMPFIFISNLDTENLTQNYLKSGGDNLTNITNIELLPDSIEYAISKNRSEELQKKKSRKLKKSFDELREQLSKQHVASEEELYHIARLLHEELGQTLGALKIDISMFGRKVFAKDHNSNGEQLYSEFNAILESIDNITQTIKKMSSGLRPEILDELGVIEAIKWLITQFEKNHKLTFEVYLPETLEGDRIFPITLYRIIQGALTNIASHTDATRVRLELRIRKDIKERKDIVLLRIATNGETIKAEDFKINNLEIRERVGILDGQFEVSSRNPVGKVISARIPVERQHSLDRRFTE